MTFRAKTSVKRAHRPAYEADHHRQLLMNVGFGVVVLVALLILAGAIAASWYEDHLAPLAVVNGQSVTKDDFRERVRVENFRLDYRETQIRKQMQSGRLDDASGQNRLNSLTQQRSSIDTQTIEALIDSRLQDQLAVKQGVSVTPQQVDALITEAATTPELRHLWVMGVKPLVTAPATTPTDQQKAVAKARAEQSLKQLKQGYAWEAVAKQLTDDVYSSKSGEVGWVSKDGISLDPALADALFALPVDGLTGVIEGKDGLFRIGRVSGIDPTSIDQALEQKIKDSGIGLESYRRAARDAALAKALSDKLIADVVDQATPQRHVAEIFLPLSASTQQTVGDEVKTRHILFSPNHDPQAAAALAANDPAWATAKADADAAYALLQKDPTQFADLAKNNSDDEGSKTDGGQLPYYSQPNLDKAFGDAIFQVGLAKDQVLPPVKTSFGWHVIQFQDRRKQPADRMADIRTQASAPGADFGAIAKANSEAVTKDNGGDAGWIAKYQLDSVREIAIFKAPVGGLTDVVTISSGIYLYKILAEETRKPDETQTAILRSKAYENWYTAEKLFAFIERKYADKSNSIPAVQ